MIRSKRIQDYFEAEIESLIPGIALTFPVHLFFALNDHIIIWMAEGFAPSKEFLERYRSRGIHKIWIHSSDRAAYEAYRSAGQAKSADAQQEGLSDSAPTADPQAPSSPEQAEAAADPAPRAAKTSEGALIAAVSKSQGLTQEEKQAIISETAKEILRQAVQPDRLEDQAKTDKKAWETIQDLLDATADNVSSAVADVWKLAKVEPDLEHSVYVATYAVIFAMAFGKIDPELVADMATAGLLHDVGLSQVPASVAARIWKSMTPQELERYSEHVAIGLEIIAEFSPALPDRVRALIHQHHEKFDGSGYPQKLSGFKIDDVAQLLALADLLHAMSSGQWDGTRRTLKETFGLLEQLEKARTFPEFFNPDIFSAVMHWIRSKPSADLASRASSVVGVRAREIIEGKDSAA